MMNDMNEDKDRVITLAEASEIYGFNHGYLRRLIHSGRLEARKSGHVWLTTPADVENYIRSREKRGKYREDIEA
jgi:excisionase family DNA binding protein